MTILLRLEYCSRSAHLCAEDFYSVFSSLTALVSSCMVLIKLLAIFVLVVSPSVEKLESKFTAESLLSVINELITIWAILS